MKIFIRNAEDRPYLGFSYKSLISDAIGSGKRNYCNILGNTVNWQIQQRQAISRKITKIL